MKTISTSIILGLATLLALPTVAEEYGYFYRAGTGTNTWNQSVSLHSGDSMTILAVDDTYLHLNLTMPDSVTISLHLTDLGILRGGGYSQPPGTKEDRTIVGPCTVVPQIGGNSLYVAYKIKRAVDNSISPSNVISLPADVNGDMQLVFESSDDLLNWSQVYSFTHNSTNQSSKFFRTRLIQVDE